MVAFSLKLPRLHILHWILRIHLVQCFFLQQKDIKRTCKSFQQQIMHHFALTQLYLPSPPPKKKDKTGRKNPAAKPRNSWLVNTCGFSLAELTGKPISEVLSQSSKKPLKDTLGGFFPGAKRWNTWRTENSPLRDVFFGGELVGWRFLEEYDGPVLFGEKLPPLKKSSCCYFVILKEVYNEN